MRRVYAVLAGLLMLAVVAQFYFAAVGAFDRPQDDKSFTLHSMTGMAIIPVLALLATVAAAVSRAPGRTIGMTLLPVGLVVVQVLIVSMGKAFNDSGDNTTPVGLAILGLHAINGLAIMAVAGIILRRARRLVGERGANSPAASSAEVATGPSATRVS